MESKKRNKMSEKETIIKGKGIFVGREAWFRDTCIANEKRKSRAGLDKMGPGGKHRR